MHNIKSKTIVVPVDGSDNSLKSLDYLFEMFNGDDYCAKIVIIYILPDLPSLFDDAITLKQTSDVRLKSIEVANLHMAEKILSTAKSYLVDKGFDQDRIKTVSQTKHSGIARDICKYAQSIAADAIVLTNRGRSRLEMFLMGEIAIKVLEFSQVVPVWLINGTIKNNRVLVAMDTSEASLKAAIYASEILAPTHCHVILFHSKRHLRKFIPQEVIGQVPELEELWRNKAGRDIAPNIKSAQAAFVNKGFTEDRLWVKIIDGSRSEALDIIKEANDSGCDTVIMGKKGVSGVREFLMGSVTRKVIQNYKNCALWIVH